jgi:hypothetical protein
VIGDFEVWYEIVDFNRNVSVYVTVGGDGFLHPEDSTFVVSPEKKPFMVINPALFDFKEFVRALAQAIEDDERRPPVRVPLREAFQDEIERSRSS